MSRLPLNCRALQCYCLYQNSHHICICSSGCVLLQVLCLQHAKQAAQQGAGGRPLLASSSTTAWVKLLPLKQVSCRLSTKLGCLVSG